MPFRLSSVSLLAAAAVLAASVASADGMQLHLFPDADVTGARCLDGTPSGFYASFNTSNPNFVIFLQGGGLCVEALDCLNRAKSSLGSSSYWSPTFTDNDNVCSSGSFNPFREWNRVFVPYCTGDVYVSNSTEKNAYMGDLYTSGHVVVREVVKTLMREHGMASAENVLLSGASAGGIGTFKNADYVASQLSPSTHYAAAPQAGWYLPDGVEVWYERVLDINVPIGQAFAWYVGSIFGNELLAPACVADLTQQGLPPHLCWDAPIAYKYINSPLFIAENVFDSNQLLELLLAPHDWQANSKAKDFVRDFGQRMTTSVITTVNAHAAAKRTDSVFFPKCFSHTGSLCMNGGPVVNGSTFHDALAAWFLHDAAPHMFLDACEADGLPCNSVCTCG